VKKDGFLWTVRDNGVSQHPLLKSTCHVDFCFNTRSVYLNLVKKANRCGTCGFMFLLKSLIVFNSYSGLKLSKTYEKLALCLTVAYLLCWANCFTATERE